MRTPSRFAIVSLLLCSAANAVQATKPVTATAELKAAELDAIVQRVIAQERVVGASVLVARNDRVLLHKGYGFADLGLEAPAKDETVYHVVGPMLPFTGIAVMQQVERGKLSLDDDISKFIPEFPLQGHHVTVRQLLNHTSGIVDYHYLGDPIEATSRQPKALDEVMALYAGKNWVNESGKKWDWSISGFNLLVTIVERVTGQSFPDYVQQNIFKPAGVKSTSYCDDFTLTRGLAHAYRKMGAGVSTNYVEAHENGMAYNSDLRFCSTVGDLLQLWRAIKEKSLVRPETFKQMTTAEGAAQHMSAQDPKAQYGFAMILNHEEDHRRIGQHGSLMGYSGSLYDFPEDNLTIIVLTNTEDQNAYAITRALGRAILGLPALPAPKHEPEPTLADKPISADERKQLAGTFVLKLDKVGANLHDSFAQYRRTYRVFDENGRLMIQPLGEGPERLLKQDDGSYAMRSSPASHISFVVQNGHAASMKLDSPGFPLVGERVGDGDAGTFHGQGSKSTHPALVTKEARRCSPELRANIAGAKCTHDAAQQSALSLKMPTKPRRENVFIERFLSAYEDHSWEEAPIDPLDQRVDGAVEALATRSLDGKTLAIEHTIIEPFIGEKADFYQFEPAFLEIEKDESLLVKDKWIRVFVPVGTLHGHHKQASRRLIVRGVHCWLKENLSSLQKGDSDVKCLIKGTSNRPDSELSLTFKVVHLPGPGKLHVRRQQTRNDLGEVVEKALRTKVPKLTNTVADRRILLLERQHMILHPKMILAEIEKRREKFPDLARVDQIWIVETMAYETESILYFERYQDGVSVEGFGFHGAEFLG